MSVWQADIDTPSFGAGAHLHVLSPHQSVRVQTADQLSIETPSRQRVSAIVLDRTGSALTLSVVDGPLISLSVIADKGPSKSASRVEFPGEDWVVN